MVSGIWLFQRPSGGAPAALMATPIGMGFAVGGSALPAVRVWRDGGGKVFVKGCVTDVLGA
jgi:hypothetical protein